MNNFFKPILLMMAFAVSMLSFSNESFATCTIGTVELVNATCTGENTFDGTLRVPVTIGGGTTDYTISYDINSGANTGTSGTQSGNQTVDIPVTGIMDADGSISVVITLNGNGCADMETVTLMGPANCPAAPTGCEDCVPSGNLFVEDANGAAEGGEICNDTNAPNDTFEAQTLESNGTITNRTVVFNANQTITLNAGFSATMSGTTTFTATSGQTISCTPLTGPDGDADHRLAVDPTNIATNAAVKVTPNPFSSSATIDYTLETEGQVMIQVFNLKGEPVATLMNGTQVAGQHTVNFEAANLPKGFYYLSLQTANERVTEQMVIMR